MLATMTLFTAATEPCALPDGYSDFTLIVRDAAAIAAKNVYTAIAIGGDLSDATPADTNTIPSETSTTTTTSWIGSWTTCFQRTSGKIPDCRKVRATPMFQPEQVWSINMAGPYVVGADPSTFPLPWDDFEQLALTAQPQSDGPYTVIVHDQGGEYSTDDACHTTITSADGGNFGASDYGRTLHVFRGAGTVCLASRQGTQFGPSVVAPFARVVVDGGVGYVDGSIVARSLGAGGGADGRDVQLHGRAYHGPLQCDAAGGADVLDVGGDDVERKMVRVECEATDTTPARTCLYREGSEPRMPCCTTCKGGSCPGEGGVAAQ